MYRMICGKYDSLWKWQWRFVPGGLDRKTHRELGHFDTAMNYARQTRGGVRAIQHARNQPWETWQSYNGK